MAMNINHNFTKFEENGVKKQEKAYKMSYANNCFEYSCEICCAQNKRPNGTCANCPIKNAHIKAIKRIKENPEKKVGEIAKKGCSTYKTKVHGNVKVTVVMHF